MSIPSDDLESNIPSKSQRKRDSEKLQLMGSQLVEMPDNQLQKNLAWKRHCYRPFMKLEG